MRISDMFSIMQADVKTFTSGLACKASGAKYVRYAKQAEREAKKNGSIPDPSPIDDVEQECKQKAEEAKAEQAAKKAHKAEAPKTEAAKEETVKKEEDVVVNDDKVEVVSKEEVAREAAKTKTADAVVVEPTDGSARRIETVITKNDEGDIDITANVYMTTESYKKLDPTAVAYSIYNSVVAKIDEWAGLFIDPRQVASMTDEELKAKNEEFDNVVLNIMRKDILQIPDDVVVTVEQMEEMLYSIVDENTVNSIIQAAIIANSDKIPAVEEIVDVGPEELKEVVEDIIEEPLKVDLTKNIVKDAEGTKMNLKQPIRFVDNHPEEVQETTANVTAEEPITKQPQKKTNTTRKKTTTPKTDTQKKATTAAPKSSSTQKKPPKPPAPEAAPTNKAINGEKVNVYAKPDVKVKVANKETVEL